MLVSKIIRSLTLLKKYLPEIVFFSFWFLLFLYIWPRMLYFDGKNYWTNSVNVWGDWSLHFTYIFNFVHRSFPLAFHPMYWGEPIRYHFVADLLSALLLKFHFSLITATIVPSLLSSLFLIVISYLFYKEMFEQKLIALLAPVLFFFNGGLGFLWTLYDSLTLGDMSLQMTEHQLTLYPEKNISWINVIIGELISQRAFLLGLPIALYILLYFWRWYKNNFLSISPVTLTFLGSLTGLFPIIHYHSFYVIILVAVYISFLMRKDGKNIKILLWYFVPLLLVSCAIYLTFIGKFVPTQLIQLRPGWIAPKNLFEFGWYWINNIGIMTFLIPLSYFFLPKKIKLFGMPFIFLFIVSNIFIFQRDPWDNRKFFIYWYFFSSGSVAYFLWKIWKTHRKITICIIILVFYTSVASGLVDILSLPHKPSQARRLFSVDDLEFGQKIRNITDSESVFLTLPGFSWLGMTLGRQAVMGFEHWVQNFGYPVTERGNDIAAIYRGEEQTPKLLHKYAISYVVFGPQERARGNLNEPYFSSHFPILIQNKETTIYDVRGIRE